MQESLDNPSLEPFADCFHTLVNQENHQSNALEEWQFAEFCLMPYLKTLFPRSEGFQISDPTRSSEAGKAYISLTNNTLIAPEPDVVISKDDVERLGGEFKRPNKKCVSVSNDLVKLGNELKFMLDTLIHDGNNDSTYVVGILLEGVKCSTYKLDLNYNGVYRLVELSCSDLMSNDFDFYPSISIFENIAQLKPLYWLRKSFLPPLGFWL
ncbi:uncharacterized protein BYT42DRAFT_212166 [Radiomyces spectabilis]|uniref:uncharacterized protein n=1 Tax=Radiomyces spectabilis TaxID=64574 RepID=UPI00221F2A77|nr:uncharacterized protein BYT42DRAFT_212166 [Radiomyces spectabilis]KAI8364356.1 hypothetical protein BYT42DRAFT_212166 [Radiomyces spectabilis]